MKILNYILAGFGFEGWFDFKASTFGFILSFKIVSLTAIFATISTIINEIFGISYLFFIAYVVLILFEWFTGVKASFKRKEKHESKKLGRMVLKVAVYSVPIYILNIFQKEVQFPVILEYEVDPFSWLYWTVLLVIIWQLIVSLLENLEQLNIKYAAVLLKIINRKFYKRFDIEEEEEDNNNKKGKTKE